MAVCDLLPCISSALCSYRFIVKILCWLPMQWWGINALYLLSG